MIEINMEEDFVLKRVNGGYSFQGHPSLKIIFATIIHILHRQKWEEDFFKILEKYMEFWDESIVASFNLTQTDLKLIAQLKSESGEE